MTSRYCAVRGPPSKKCSAARGAMIVRHGASAARPHVGFVAPPTIERIVFMMLRAHKWQGEQRHQHSAVGRMFARTSRQIRRW